MKYKLIMTAIILYILLCMLGACLDFLKDDQIRLAQKEYFELGQQISCIK